MGPPATEFIRAPLSTLLRAVRERGRAGLPVVSVTLNAGLVERNPEERRVETALSAAQHLLVKRGDIAYNMMRMWQGACGLASTDCLVSPAYVVLRMGESLRPGFAYRLFKSPKLIAAFLNHSRGLTSDRYRLYPADLLRIEVSIPHSPEVQDRIAEILDALDEAIRGTERVIAKLQQMKQGLLHDLLTRGIDENGELRDPERHPEQFKDSPLGRIPKQWTSARLAEVVPRAEYGISLALSDRGEIPVLRMMNLDNGEADLADLKYSDAPQARALPLRPGDVLFNRTNSIDHVGRSGIWRGQLAAASFASYLVRLVPDAEALTPEFLNRWLNWELTQLRIRRYATPGVHQVNINPTNLRKTTIALPALLSEQTQIAEILMAHDRQRQTTAIEREKLLRLKHGLMDDLLTGRVRVPVPEEARP